MYEVLCVPFFVLQLNSCDQLSKSRVCDEFHFLYGEASHKYNGKVADSWKFMEFFRISFDNSRTDTNFFLASTNFRRMAQF